MDSALPEENPLKEPGHGPGGCRRTGRLHTDQQGATTLEWVLLAGCIALPSYYLMQAGLNMLAAHFRMMGVMSGLPVP